MISSQIPERHARDREEEEEERAQVSPCKKCAWRARLDPQPGVSRAADQWGLRSVHDAGRRRPMGGLGGGLHDWCALRVAYFSPRYINYPST